MNNIVADKAQIAALLAELDIVEPGHYLTLEPGHPLYQEPVDVWVRPLSEIRNADSLIESIGMHFPQATFADILDLNGEKVDSENVDGYPMGSHYFLPNAFHRVGDYVMIGRGQYFATAERMLDGEPAIEFVTAAQAVRLDRAEKAKFLPALHAALPVWADKDASHVLDYESAPGQIEVTFGSVNFVPQECKWDAELSIVQWAVIDVDGNVVSAEQPNASIDIPENRSVDKTISAADLAFIAEGMRKLAAEYARVTGGTRSSLPAEPQYSDQ